MSSQDSRLDAARARFAEVRFAEWLGVAELSTIDKIGISAYAKRHGVALV